MKGNIVREESIQTDLLQVLLFVVVIFAVAIWGVLKGAFRLFTYLGKPLLFRFGRSMVAGVKALKPPSDQ